jgi:hypothetical protein
MPNPWTGKGNPYTREEVRARLQATLDKGNAIIAQWARWVAGAYSFVVGANSRST